MTDRVDAVARSRIMASVRSKNTKPEIILRKALFSLGFRYRLHSGSLPGKPDLVLPKFKAVIFINGCFWHWHGCKHSRLPSENYEYWLSKISKNRERDQKNYERLIEQQWRILIVWECALSKSGIANSVRRVESWLKGRDIFSIIEPDNDT